MEELTGEKVCCVGHRLTMNQSVDIIIVRIYSNKQNEGVNCDLIQMIVLINYEYLNLLLPPP